MKIIFNDGTELQVQSVHVDASGALRIKTISATQDQLRAMFYDAVKTKKITVVEREQTIAVYENYTTFEGITVYTAGILEPFLYKAGETPAEKMDKLQQENTQLKETVEMLQGCILEMSELVYQ
ncbi:hypothetical protein [Faecalicatena contorta]|uniref:hypothetical protein n=1 Tax=Faecalicatena contorta TaxID=39482 RepID=UPI001F3F8C1B|nr:hypothetical protein [Faecalicatena contorta]MCF2555740.1 hypothetical protein [Faecalicatena contorta]